MPEQGARTHRVIAARPIGLAAGGAGLVFAWGGGAAIARLTGATPVVIVLAVAAVWFFGATVAGWWAIDRVRVRDISLPPVVVAGEPFPVACTVVAPRPVWVEVRAHGATVASGWSDGAELVAEGVARHRGAIDRITVRVSTPGATGLVWWRRGVVIDTEVLVAPPAESSGVPVVRSATGDGGRLAGRPGAVAGEIDGVRPWREGDSEKFVHWSSTLRTGELVVHDRLHEADQRWVVRARPGLADPDAEAAGARFELERGLWLGADVSAAVGDGEVAAIADRDAAARWCALADLGAPEQPKRKRGFHRPVIEPETTARQAARWWSAGATIVAIVMLSTALGYHPLVTLMMVSAVVVGAAVSAPLLASGAPAPGYVRILVAIGAVLAFLGVASTAGQLSGLLGLLRGPLPQILIILIALHGFECRDRRTVRVALSISAVVLMYASGFRVDSTIGIWLLAWGVCFAVAQTLLAGPTRRHRITRRAWWRTWAPGSIAVAAGAAASVALLAIVPVPDGPARLSLPTFIDDRQPVGLPGAVAGPDGAVRNDDEGSDQRAPAGQAGGYTGFARTMDTSVRGELSDQVVMRVRAPEADFWRGQTFAEFDGRRWYADDETGEQRAGPEIEVPPVVGDTLADDVPVQRFVQTYFAAVDMPNVVFAAYRPNRIILDADVWTRDDGAIRASTVLPKDSVYTVVSLRPQVTTELLQRQGRIDQRLSQLGRQVFARYLQVPESTSAETIALATDLAAGYTNTYDTVRAYEAWIGQHVEYDLNAPLPDEGEDAVHDFLFDSRRGFCEQIASALTIMLRTQGVPARLATGYAPGARDRVAGVFEVRASDAHAWVEVWFPETGWQAFDPTASVPLAGEAQTGSIGEELVGGAASAIAERPALFALSAAIVFGTIGATRLALVMWRRRRRGRWGVLQDRFGSLATRLGAPPGATNPSRAVRWTAADDAAVARAVAERLDRVAFDPTFADDDGVYDETRKLIGTLAGRHR